MSDINSSRFSIATLNLFNYLAPPNAYYQFDNIYTSDEWQGKQAWLGAYLKQLNSDMVGFQEVFSSDELKQQTQALGYRYFACLDEPKVESDYVYSQPPVAFASRFPIISSTKVDSIALRNMKTGRQFSRAPLHCVVQVPNLGLVNVLVVHLKSQRSSIEESEEMSSDQRHQASVHGRWLSTQQRGGEAEMLSHYVGQLRREQRRPTIVMGDFNHDVSSQELQSLANKGSLQKLTDSVSLQRFPSNSRQATHYYGEKGNVLDYILVSSDFTSASAQQSVEVDRVDIFDQHLVSPSFEHDRYASDHAAVKAVVDITR